MKNSINSGCEVTSKCHQFYSGHNGTIDKTYNCYRKNNFPRKIFSDNTLFNAVIGLAALSGVLALLLSITVYLICKMRITHGNPINLNFSHLQAPGRGIFTGQKRIQMLTRSTLAQLCDLQHHLVVLFFLKADFSSGLQFPPTSEHPPLVHASTHRPMCTTGTFLQLSKKPSSPTLAPPPVENQKERLKKGAMGYYGGTMGCYGGTMGY